VRPLAILLLAIPVFGQVFAQGRPDADAPNCADSKALPKLLMCRIDNCESKDGDHRDIQVRDDDKGQPVINPVDGNSRAVMYECSEEITPANIIQKAATALRAYGFDVPYQFTDKEGALTARKGDLWITLEAASHFYTVTEFTATAPDFDSIIDAPSILDALQKTGKAPLYGITFLPGRADIAPESVIALHEIVALMQDNLDLRLRVEGHTDSTGAQAANQILSVKRAQAVVDYLVKGGLKRVRFEVTGMGDTVPVADNSTEAGRTRNRRIQLVKIEAK
jgi:outer membrane protein OmpA-like peptidoglycan-associated protein